MKDKNYHIFNEFKSIDRCSHFQAIPAKLVAQNSYMFSAFKRRRNNHSLSNHVHDDKIQKQSCQNQLLGTNKDLNKSLLMFRNSKENQFLKGILKTGKSHIKKLKLKQFYISQTIDQQNIKKERFENQNSEAQNNNVNKNKPLMCTLQSKSSLEFHNNNVKFNRKKNLPIKLRAQSYSKFPKKIRSFWECLNQNESEGNNKQNLVLTSRQNQRKKILQIKKSEQIDSRSIVGSCENFKNNQNDQNKNERALQDISMKLEKNKINDVIENSKKELGERFKKRRQVLKNKSILSGTMETELNPWNTGIKQEDKQNDILFYY